MDSKKVIDKLENDLSHYLINEMCKSDPSKRSSPEMYKYKGLSITPNEKENYSDRSISVRIGVLEAEFKINSCEKNSGSLAPEEERLISIWMLKSENKTSLKDVFGTATHKTNMDIIPFDLENYYS